MASYKGRHYSVDGYSDPNHIDKIKLVGDDGQTQNVAVSEVTFTPQEKNSLVTSKTEDVNKLKVSSRAHKHQPIPVVTETTPTKDSKSNATAR